MSTPPGERGSPTPAAALEAVRRFILRRGGAAGLLGLTCVVGVILVAAWLVVGDEWSPGSPVPAILLVGGITLAGVLLAGLVRFLSRWTDRRALSSEVEREAGLRSGALRAQLELDRTPPEGVSSSLIAAGSRSLGAPLSRDASILAGVPGRAAGRLLKIGALGAVGVALVVVLMALLGPERARTAWGGLVDPATVLAAGRLPPLALEPGDTVLPRGTRARIRVQAAGRERVSLHWQGVGDPLQERMLTVEAGEAAGRLPPLEGRLRYWVSAPDGARSREAVIEPSDPLLLSDVVFELRFPAYTGRSPETIGGAPSELVLPRGTRIGVSGRVEGRGSVVLLVRESDGEAELRLPVEGSRFEGSWRPTRPGRLAWAVEGASEGASLPGGVEIALEEDQPPEVALPVPGADSELPPSFRLPLLLHAWDDHGVEWVEIEATRVDRDGVEEPPVTDRIPVDGRGDVTLRPVLDLVDWDLAPGDEVLLQARAADGSPQEQIATTPVYRLRIPEAARQREAARERIDEAGRRLDEMSRRTEEEARRLRELGREAAAASRSGDQSRFQEREELQSAARDQARLEDELDEIREEMRDARQAMEGLGDEDGGLREQFRELETLLSELTDPEDRARMDELLDRLAEGESPDAATELSDLAERREQMAEALEEALERFRREALEEAFHGAEEELEELARAQEELAQEPPSPEDAAVQDSLAAQTREAEERIEELARRLEESGEPSAAGRTEEIASEVGETREAMERAAEASRSGDPEGAEQASDEAAEGAREAFEAMEQARMEWLEEWEEQVRGELRRAAEDALSMARRQMAMGRRLPEAGAGERSALQAEARALNEGIANLAVRLGLATREAPAVGREVLEALGEAGSAVEGMTDALSGPAPLRSRAEEDGARAAQALNRAALLALTGMERVGESDGNSAMEELLDEMESLAGDQERLNQETQGLAQEGDSEGVQARMEAVAGGQEELAAALEELARREGREWTPGELEEMAEEAGELARELEEGRLDAPLLDRQEELLERLLGAGRMLERDGPTEEREGRTAEAVERRAIEPLPRDLLDGGLLTPPDPEAMSGLSPAERRLILEYFERLNRLRPGGGER